MYKLNGFDPNSVYFDELISFCDLLFSSVFFVIYH